jgi:hypothetical protein
VRARLRAARVRDGRHGRHAPQPAHAGAAALAQERYYSSHRAPQTIDAGTPAAQRQDLRSPDARDAAELASRADEAPAPDTATTDADRIAAVSWERIAAAYGEPEPLTAPQPPAPSDDPPWLAIALSSPSR